MSRRQKPSRPVDLVGGTIGAQLRLGDVLAARGDAQHAAAISQDSRAVAPRAGMKDLHVGIGAGLVEPLDLGAFRIGAGIALGRHHHAERRVVKPIEHDATQIPIGHGEKGREQVRLEPHHQHLSFGIAEAHVVFDELGRPLLDHQPGIEHALERRAPRAHGAHRRDHDLLHHASTKRRRHDGRRRICAHAPGIRALVAVEGALVVLRGRQRKSGCPVDQSEKACLLAVEKLLDHHLCAGRAERACEARIDALPRPRPASWRR